MGNSSGKHSKACSEVLLAFDSVERETLEARFKVAASTSQGGTGKEVTAASLSNAIGLGPVLGGRIFKALAASGQYGAKTSLSFDDFVVGLGKCVAWERYERREFWMAAMLDGSKLTEQGLREFFSEEVSKALPKGTSLDLRDKLLNESVTQALESWGASEVGSEDGQKWLAGQQRVESFFLEIMTASFLRPPAVGGAVSQAKKMPRLSRKSLLLKEEHLWTIAGHIPPQCNVTPWKMLFNSSKHGKSFSRFMSKDGKIIFKGPTVIVIRDHGANVFGLYAAVSWRKHNKFYGESSSFLFSVAPKCRVYPSSGVNQNYQFMSTNLTSCTNGVGIGGQIDYWGIHVGNMMEEGFCRAPCSTFAQMPCLSSEPRFKIDYVEVWQCMADYVADEKELEAAGVKKKPRKNLDEYLAGKNKTCLEGDVEAQAILNAAGRTNYSADVRAADALADKEREALQGGPDQEGDSDESVELEYED